MKRSIETWAKSDPALMAKQSEAAIYYAFRDAQSDIAELARQKADAERRIAELEAERDAQCLQWAKWIVRCGQGLPDHACAKCVPHSDMLIEGFVCAYHKAEDYLASTLNKDRKNG